MKKCDEQIKHVFANNKCTCTSNMYVIHYDVFHECFFSTQVYISKVLIYLAETVRNQLLSTSMLVDPKH